MQHGNYFTNFAPVLVCFNIYKLCPAINSCVSGCRWW